MKKIFTSLLALGGLGVTTHAQLPGEVDLEPRAIMINDQILTPGLILSTESYFNQLPANNDSVPALIAYGIAPDGGTLETTDTFGFFGPWMEMSAEGTMGFHRGYAVQGNEVTGGPDWTVLMTLGSDWVRTTDSINTLLNIEFVAQNGIGENGGMGQGYPFEDILLRRSELVNGQTYGWYTHMRPYPSWEEASYVDPNKSNNWNYTPIIWNGGGTSLADLVSKTNYTHIDVYPNPSVDKINFSLDIDPNNRSTVIRVLDNTGRVVISKFYDKGSMSNEQSLDVSSFAVGTYQLQVICDRAIYVSSFVKH